MKKKLIGFGLGSITGVLLFATLFFGWPLLAEIKEAKFLSFGGREPSEPQILVTAEYMPFTQLMEPEVMALAKKHDLLVAPNIRDNYLNDGLDRFLTAYREAGIEVVFWPLLPREQCLYLNEEHTDDFLAQLDKIYAWADERGHQVNALIVDIEPPNCQTGSDRAPDEKAESDATSELGQIWDLIDKEKFEAAIPKFQEVLDKLHEHNTVAVSTAMDYAAVDLVTGTPVVQDIAGGPSMLIDWDYVSFMNFGSQNTKFIGELLAGLGMKWDVDDTRYLSYLICKVIAKKYGNRAAISLGQTIPGEGHGAVWTDPADLGKDASACKAAGIIHFGIYDFQGIVESPNPEAWILAVKNAKAEKPKYSAKAVTLWNTMKMVAYYAQMRRDRAK